LSKSKNHFREI